MTKTKTSEYGNIVFKLNGELHRANGPARVGGESWSWWLNGVRHRYYGYCTSWDYWYINGDKIK